jgi:hypothetical protein
MCYNREGKNEDIHAKAWERFANSLYKKLMESEYGFIPDFFVTVRDRD